MERIEDKSKALSYIGIEIAEALKYIPAPEDDVQEFAGVEEKAETETVVAEDAKSEIVTNIAQATETVTPVEGENVPDFDNYFEETRFEVKPTVWQRIKNSKFVRTLRFIMQIRVVLDYPALPEGRE